MTPVTPRQRTLIDSGLSNQQAARLSQELAARGIGVECTPSRLAGWDVWAFASLERVASAADD